MLSSDPDSVTASTSARRPSFVPTGSGVPPSLAARRRSSVFPAPSAAHSLHSTLPPHTALTLAERRRSSLRPPIPKHSKNASSTSQARAILARFIPALAPPPSTSSSLPKTRLSHPVAFAPPVPASRDQQKDEYRRQSHAMGLLEAAETLRRRAAGTRRMKKMYARVAIVLLLLLIMWKCGRGASSSALANWELTGTGGVGGVHLGMRGGEVQVAKAGKAEKSSSGWRRKVANPVETTRGDGKDSRSHFVRMREEELWKAPEFTLDDAETWVVPEKAGYKHEETVIFLHGLAQHARDSAFMPSLLADRFPSVRWVMPQAPLKTITVRQNETTPGWFDMRAFPYDNSRDEDPHNLFLSTRQINALIRTERNRLIRNLRTQGGLDALPAHERAVSVSKDEEHQRSEKDGEMGSKAEREWASSKIVLAGFSQGSVMTLLAGLTHEERLAGLAVFSGYMPVRKLLPQLVADLDRATLPIFWGHGEKDPYLTCADANHSVELLRARYPTSAGEGGMGLSNINYYTYPGLEHTWFPTEMAHLARWMERVLPSMQTPRVVGKEGWRKMK